MRGLFINLDRSPDRRLKMEKQIEALGLGDTYKRFPAVDGRVASRRATSSRLSDGEVSIFKSHFDAIQTAQETNTYTHVMEDDAILSRWLKPYLIHAEKLGLLSLSDIVFLDFGFRPDLFSFKYLAQASAQGFQKPKAQRSAADFNLIDVRLHYSMGMASYVVNPASVPKLVSLLHSEWIAGPRLAIDIFVRKLIEERIIKVGGVLPFLTTVGLDEAIATQSGRQDDATTMAATTMLRQSFFIDRELDQLTEAASRLVPSRVPNQHQALLYKLAGFFQ
jgi:GR25 family glycosyltransferase involved in LPS biosynthesis